ncbi:exodeoxyribonuclease V subunit gamma [Thorsellia anophelis]|uniref:RecBCD enzyme subunit RecC n=1 Tax=Thorsellia anophelis DSM 18579 TaxID=1123402 RepID=A0A1H9ZD15_9GAMM|nr:exodeoxyribonuclease V subunit gamma [Thorsellia anophelis]SES79435.1 DNA helicase/exodeoxyribonuclease V, gamma subunit [Thorsellia anophelis DSM 18579]
MFTIYHSNKLDVLKNLIAHLMQMSPLRSAMQKETIVVQSSGMAKWLQIELGQTLGVLANVDFPLPATYLWRLFTSLKQHDGRAGELQFDKLTMTWLLMDSLPQQLKYSEFESIKRYLSDDVQDKKLYHLALKCADLFDHYLVYRPEWTIAWEKGNRIDSLGEAEAWQALLWLDISKKLNEYAASKNLILSHKASMYDELIEYLNKATPGSLNLPERIFICGISALPPLYIEVLEALGNHCDVHLMYTNPCRYYWADIQEIATQIRHRLQLPLKRNNLEQNIKTTFSFADLNLSKYPPLSDMVDTVHPLLANWGKLARDQLFQFASLRHVQEIEAFVEEPSDNLLSQLKADILNLTNRQVLGLKESDYQNSRSKVLLDEHDLSVSFHVCHSTLREVEVLYDYLLHQFNSNSELTPKDVVVMVSDIALYTPYIEAVFGNAPKSRYLPFSISDRSVKSTHPIVEVVSQLLQLPDKRFKVEEIMTLLAVPALGRKFNITPDALSQLQHWIEQTHIYWARDDEWLMDQGLPPTGQFTWRFGLDRLLLGLTRSENTGLWQNIAPYGGGQIEPALVGQFCEIIERLMAWQDNLQQARTLGEWQPMLTQLFDDLFEFNDAEVPLSIILLDVWDSVVQSGLTVSYHQSVNIDLLHEAWLILADNDKGSHKFLAGKINFCTLMPMRSIPFKQVCLLGMSEALYPRKVTPVSFDLMNNHTQRGDRSRRDDDRYLFLEAIISAEDALYISYVGLGIQDNQPKNPSLVVSELIDYLAQSYVLEAFQGLSCDDSSKKMREHFMLIHSRVPYAPENYQLKEDVNTPSINQSQLSYQKSFASEWLSTLNQTKLLGSEFNQAIPYQFDPVVEFTALLRFFQHPVEYYFKSILGVVLNEYTTVFENDEPFTLDGLAKYGLKKQLFEDKVNAIEFDYSRELLRAKGHLPAFSAGELVLQETNITIDALYLVLKERYSQLFEKNKQKMMLEINLNLVELFARIEGIDEFAVTSQIKHLLGWLEIDKHYGLIEWRVGSLGAKYTFNFWLKHIIYCLALPEKELELKSQKNEKSTFVGVKGQDVQIRQFELLTRAEASQYLLTVLDYFQRGHQSILLALPESCFQYAQNSLSEKPKNLSILHEHEQNNVYLKRYFAQPIVTTINDDMANEIIQCSKDLYYPLFVKSNISELN